MATELTATISISHTANGVDFAETIVSSTEDLTGNGITAGVMSVTTAALAVPLGGVTTPGVAYFKNLNATNYIEIGWDDSGFVAASKLLPGQVALIPLINAPWAKANTGACLMQYRILER